MMPPEKRGRHSHRGMLPPWVGVDEIVKIQRMISISALAISMALTVG
jgi:hypothetical protein